MSLAWVKAVQGCSRAAAPAAMGGARQHKAKVVATACFMHLSKEVDGGVEGDGEDVGHSEKGRSLPLYADCSGSG
jgi:hypothetical protein